MLRVRAFIAPVCAGLVLLAAMTVISCGGDDLVVGSGQPIVLPTPGPTATPKCGQSGDACVVNTDCCSGICSIVTGGCQ